VVPCGPAGRVGLEKRGEKNRKSILDRLATSDPGSDQSSIALLSTDQNCPYHEAGNSAEKYIASKGRPSFGRLHCIDCTYGDSEQDARFPGDICCTLHEKIGRVDVESRRDGAFCQETGYSSHPQTVLSKTLKPCVIGTHH
jgi:hypothetical protein